MSLAGSTLINSFLGTLEDGPEAIEDKFITLAALVIAIDDAAVVHAFAWADDKDDPDMPGRRIRALIRMARDRHEELAEEIQEALRVISDRTALFDHLTSQDDPNALVREALHEATFVIEQSGACPIILMFDKDELRSLGKNPWAQLVGLQEQAVGCLEAQAGETVDAAKQALAEALKLSKLLATGAEVRDWSD